MILGHSLDKYLMHARLVIKRRFAFKLDMLLMMGIQIINPLIMLFVWIAIYFATQTTTINNFSLAQIETYFFVVAAANSIIPTVSWTILSDIKTGALFAVMTKPLSYVKTIIAAALANLLIDALGIAFPILLIVYFATSTILSIPLLALFLLSLCIMFTLWLMFEVFLGYLSFFVVETSGIINMFYFIGDFLGGWLVPLNLLPSSIGSLTSILPFQFFYYYPAAIFTHAISGAQAIGMLPLAAFWLLVMLSANWIIISLAKKHMNVVGV
ncbi:MAG: ABC-2 family transporter protein [Candidatus Micrarchaeota archaeon]|nr:ABC-2 family transporter protein [Candidatus Micrarchaeota archaeon]